MKGIKINLTTAIILLTLMYCLSFSAHSEESTTANSENKVYESYFFDKFVPQTALDMLLRVPGFTIDSGNQVRGFGAGAGNVLIDGERLSVKSVSLINVLRRIPANTVTKIEIIRGTQQAAQTAGQGVVANIVTSPAVFSGTYSVKAEENVNGKIYPNGQLSIISPIGDWETSTRIQALWEKTPLVNASRTQFGPTGDILRFQREDVSDVFTSGLIESEATTIIAGGVFNLNARLYKEGYYFKSTRTGFVDASLNAFSTDSQFIDLDDNRFESELSADWTKTISDNWSMKLIGLTSFEDGKLETLTIFEEPVGEEFARDIFTLDEKPFEAVLRATFTNFESNIRPEYGVEATYNKLDSEFNLTIEEGGEIFSLDLPGSDVVVEEIRAEAFANFAWEQTKNISLEAGIAVEYSDIQVTGDVSNSDSFFFIKPTISLNYSASDAIQYRLSARRTVGQLSFSDFAAYADIEFDRVFGGNPELKPDQTNRLSLSADIRSQSGQGYNIELFYESKEDVIENVILSSGQTGFANAGSAQVYGVITSVSLPLDKVMKGALFEVFAEFQDATFDDPITNETRPPDGFFNPFVELSFRQDITNKKIAWGVTYLHNAEQEFFYVDEKEVTELGKVWSAFIETNAYFGVKMKIEFLDIGGFDQSTTRDFFSPDRNGLFVGSERIARTQGRRIAFTLSGQF